MKYKLKYLSGGGTEYEDGDWEYSETKTFHVFNRIRKGIYSSAHVNDIVKLKKEVYENTDTFYPRQAGIPHWFQLITSN